MNCISFDKFISTLKGSNRQLSSLVDWQKCIDNKIAISLYLHSLNYLLGRQKSDIKIYIDELFNKCKDAFQCLNILVAIRNKDEFVIARNDQEIALNNYFTNSERVYEFICDSGLVDIFL